MRPLAPPSAPTALSPGSYITYIRPAQTQCVFCPGALPRGAPTPRGVAPAQRAGCTALHGVDPGNLFSKSAEIHSRIQQPIRLTRYNTIPTRITGTCMSANKLSYQLSRGTLALVLALPLTFTAGVRPCVAAMELGQEKHFDIPPQQLPAALLKFSEQSGVQVTSPGQLIEGRKSPGVVGTFSPSKALAMLLKDTSLNYDI